jgi:antitoxin (DNA-binding transcriptional repressor) of toxin-antitoxin stability system
LVDEAAAGQEVVITKRGKPIARLIGLPTVKLRELGEWEGRAWMSDDFDAPLPDDILGAFEGRTGDCEEGDPTD